MAQFAPNRTMTVGNFKITYLNDGGGYIKPTAMLPASSDAGWSNYTRLMNEQGQLVISIGGFLIETGEQKIVMDLGFGPQTVEFPGFGPFIGGKFMDSLAEAGVAREDVTDVIYTHLHLDHVGWTSLEVDGKRELTFPNAKHVCTKADWDFWLTDESGLGPHPQAVIAPVKDVIEFIEAGYSPAPGITVLDTPGHTPGHVSLHLDAGEQEVFMIVDLLHNEAQFYEADWSVAFDIDPAAAKVTREALYPQLNRPNVIVADGHFADAVFGRVTNENGKWVWSPL
ncbi:MAG: MBL fold metallo-hydrolase [Candidatus Promineifilaceae bacterium]